MTTKSFYRGVQDALRRAQDGNRYAAATDLRRWSLEVEEGRQVSGTGVDERVT